MDKQRDAKKTKPAEPPEPANPAPQKTKVVALALKRKRGKKAPLVVFRENVDDDQNLR